MQTLCYAPRAAKTRAVVHKVFAELVMAYLPDFDHDVFISFAHVDNQDGWVEVFHQQLEVELNRLIGRMGVIKLWFDKRRLQPGQKFDTTIAEALNRTAVFVALTSTGYLHSDSYSHKEIEWFSQRANQDGWGLSIGNRSRIVNVQLANLDPARLPQEFTDALWLKFYAAEYIEQLGFPLDPKEKPFLDQIRSLSVAIFSTLEALRETVAPRLASQPAASTSIVFLADTSDSLRHVRNRVAEELQRQNISLATPIPPPFEATQHEENVAAALHHSMLSVHLFDQWEGRTIDGLPKKTYPQRQAELALEYASDVLIWVPQTLDIAGMENIEDETHRAFLQQFEARERKDTNYEFLRESKTEITRQILVRLERIKKRQLAAATPSAALLDLHRKDQMHAFQIFQLLMERNVQPYLNPEDDDPRSNLKILEERLKQVSKLILFFGAVAEDWVRSRLAEALKIAVEQRCPLKTLAVCFVPPRRKEDGIDFSTGFAKVYHFNLADIHDPITLKMLLGEL